MNDDAQKINDVNNPTERRDKMWEQSARLLGLMNGGAAVALLAFVQAIWNSTTELVVWVVGGLLAFAAGLVSATIIPLLREQTVYYWRSDKPKARIFQKRYRQAAKWSVGLFAIGVIIVAIGIWINRPKPCDTGEAAHKAEVSTHCTN